MIDNIRKIDGPINVVRLEGTVNGIKKVFYSFFDFHLELYFQSNCDDIFSTNISKYLTKNFYKISKKSDKKYDFFLEIEPIDLIPIRYYGELMYIHDLRRFFSKIFKYDEQKNLVRSPELFKNIRLHYLDIRENMVDTYHYFLYIIQKIEMMKCNNNQAIFPYIISEIIKFLNSLIERHKSLVEILNKKQINLHNSKPKIIRDRSKQSDQKSEIAKNAEYLYNKIRYNYSHENVKNIMNKILDNTILLIQDTIYNIDQFIVKLKNYYNHYNVSEFYLNIDPDAEPLYGFPLKEMEVTTKLIASEFSKIFTEFMDIYVNITDVYLLRRFLDKDYITNAIVYTGALHSLQYINILIKFFDFKITHTSYRAIDDIHKLNQEIIKTKSLSELGALLYPPILIQCSNLDGFPENFN